LVTRACRAARAADAALIVCAPRAEPRERVRALRSGVDGWIELPCHPHELLARVAAIVRGGERGGATATAATTPAGDVVHAGDLAIRSDRWQAYAGDEPAGLTTREYELLELLARNQSEVLTRERIYAALWGGTMARGDRIVDVFVSRVRLKLERVSPGWRYIHTLSGVGYRFSPRVAEPLFAAASTSVRSA
ncbi:response regulator transcription factor, partial [Conexibacter sp. JD483]|uniref:response regulator transcription factor n=2 Tax=Conexibacter TaxID=191494 RepID=UPI00286FE70B